MPVLGTGREKMYVTVTVHFPDYAFKEHMHMSCFHEWNVFFIIPFIMTGTNIL